MTLSKLDIAEYYSDPAVRAELLKQIRNRSVMAVQSRPGKKVVRRNAPSGSPIRIQKATNNAQDTSDLAWYTDRRFSEFHPTIGKKTKQVWVDIDPGPKRTVEDVKPIVVAVENALKRMPEVKDTRISYSGGRGFYVRGDLKRKTPTDAARKVLTEKLKELQLDKAVFQKPRGDEVRLDTSTLHNKGSIRADYSINSDTGRVAVPLTQRELKGFSPEQAEVRRILKEKEFAPGVPRSRRVYALPDSKEEKQWTLAIQQHDARKAGKHWDLRLVDPATGFAHSWAVPKATFPGDAQKVLAVRTPTHTAHYALNFGDHGPQTIGKGYGKGTVEIVHKEPVKVLQSGNNKLKFRRIIGDDSGKQFTLFRTKNDMWLMKQDLEEKTAAFRAGYLQALRKFGLDKRGQALDQYRNNRLPVGAQPAGLPVDRLMDAIEQTEVPRREEGSVRTPRSRFEERLNKPTEWSAASAIPQYFMEGPTPVLSGRF